MESSTTKFLKGCSSTFQMEEENKEHHEGEHSEHSHNKSGFTEKIRENPWMLATLILAAVTVILLVATFSGSLTGNVVSKEKAANNLITYLDDNIDSSITLINVTEDSGLYLANVGYKGQSIPVYITKDGSSYTTALVPILSSTPSSSNSSTQTTEVPKTDKPSVELFVMSYCPYGTQMEKAIIPVLNLLKDNINFTLRFVSYSMHGQKEVDENTRQYCIQKEQNDKFINYLSCFLQAGDSASCLTSAGIDQNKLNSCISTANSQFSITQTADATVASGSYPPYNIDKTLNEQYGVQGSPTLIINGVEVQPSSRSPEAVKGIICSAFNNVPSACSTNLSTSQASAGFGSGTSSSSSSASCS